MRSSAANLARAAASSAVSEPALSRLRVLAECLLRCRLPAERVVEILYAAIRAAPSSSLGVSLDALYRSEPEVRALAAELALCGFSGDEIDLLVEAMLEAGCAAARAKLMRAASRCLREAAITLPN